MIHCENYIKVTTTMAQNRDNYILDPSGFIN